jgi:hypothetical protein
MVPGTTKRSQNLRSIATSQTETLEGEERNA